jgi:prepilin-type N-terminal cleavage/methylation domain-containing protein
MKGFTLVELIITISLGVILVVAAIPLYGNLQVSTQLNEQSAFVVQTLRSAREQAVAGYNNSASGVFIRIDPVGADSYISYQGSSYSLRDSAYDRIKIMESPLSFQNISFTATSTNIDINFSKSTGVPNNIGNFLIVHSVSGQRNVLINRYGAISEN